MEGKISPIIARVMKRIVGEIVFMLFLINKSFSVPECHVGPCCERAKAKVGKKLGMGCETLIFLFHFDSCVFTCMK